jgi:GTP-binding protein of the ras superfamily involved in termination of M-phase
MFRRGSAAKSKEPASKEPEVQPVIKVALLGDAQVGKTSLMCRYVEGTFDDAELMTQRGVNFMEKSVLLQNERVTFSIWDVGDKDFDAMLPLVCNEAAVLLLMFDLCRPETLASLRDWHRKATTLNKGAMPFLVGVKYDELVELAPEEHAHVCDVASQFAIAIDAPLVFCSSAVPINVANIFKVILIRLFGLTASVPEIREPGGALLMYQTK